MDGSTTSAIDLLWLLLLPYGALLFMTIRAPQPIVPLIAALAILSIAWGWLIFYAWMTLRFDRLDEKGAFNSVEYLMTEVPHAWLWRYLATVHGWIPGLLVVGLAAAAARLWPRRAE